MYFTIPTLSGFPGGSDGEESACSEGDLGSIPGSGRSPGEGNSNPLQDSCLENRMDRGPGRLQSMGLHRVGNDWATNIGEFGGGQNSHKVPTGS